MADITDIAISKKASEIVDEIMELGLFKNRSDVMTFAASIVIRDYPDFDPSAYKVADAGGSNYSFSTFDTDGSWAKLIKILYPDTETPYVFLRALMVFGLEEIGAKIEDNHPFSVLSSLIKI